MSEPMDEYDRGPGDPDAHSDWPIDGPVPEYQEF